MSWVKLQEARDEQRFGGKAVQLGIARRSGLPVPDGVALPVTLVEALAEGEAWAIEAVQDAYRRLGGPLAARSSAVGEDSAMASFAGQHLSVLNVAAAEALVEAVRAIWQSGRSEAALAYRARLGMAGVPRVAVVVQRLLAPEVAGVLFTRCPLTGDDQLVIEATWGLGEALVSGLVTPDCFRLDRYGRVIARQAGYKDLALVAAATGGTAEVPVDAGRVEALCLNDGQLHTLHELALTCEAVYGDVAHDVEWAFAEGRLHFLQRRPVVGRQG